MIPAAAVLAAIKLATAALEGFNALPLDLRVRIVTTILDEHEARKAAWERFAGWFRGLLGGVKW